MEIFKRIISTICIITSLILISDFVMPLDIFSDSVINKNDFSKSKGRKIYRVSFKSGYIDVNKSQFDLIDLNDKSITYRGKNSDTIFETTIKTKNGVYKFKNSRQTKYLIALCFLLFFSSLLGFKKFDEIKWMHKRTIWAIYGTGSLAGIMLSIKLFLVFIGIVNKF